MGIIGSIFSGINSSKAAKAAANSQMVGAQNAQKEIQKGEGQARDFQNQEWTQQQANEQPFLALGQSSANHLADIINGPGFQAPTLEQARQTPGYQFTLEQGTNAINQNAAANGTLLSGNTGAALEKYGQGLADTTYNDVYNRALGGTQVGQNAAGQLGAEGQAAAQNMTGIDLGGAESQAQQINNAAAARASGYVGSANAYNSMFSNIDKQINQVGALAYQLGMGQ